MRTCLGRPVGAGGERSNAGAAITPLTGAIRLLIASAWASCIAASALASDEDGAIAAICESAAHQVARESGVPVSVLMAISLTETGRKHAGAFRPWPWTVNMEGKGVWFDGREDAQDYVDRNFARGARSFDVGCFQINYRWHGQAFSSLEEMFEPLANARYAARFLNELYGEFGDWSKAAGAYHSRTPKFANRYRARFDRFRARLGDTPPPPVEVAAYQGNKQNEPAIPAPQDLRQNLYPLLQRKGGTQGPGSLVPLQRTPASGQRLIGGAVRG